MEISAKSTCLCTIIGCFLKIDFIPGLGPRQSNSVLAEGRKCLPPACSKDLGKVVFMMGVLVFRLVYDIGVFTIAGSSIGDPIGSSSAVVNRAASTVV
jgi:hypothetical protein